MKTIAFAALLAATPALALAQHDGQMGSSMGREGQAQPHSPAADHASGAAYTASHKMHHAPAKRRAHRPASHPIPTPAHPTHDPSARDGSSLR